MEDIISNRQISSYPKSIYENIVLVSIDKERSFPIGTMSYSYALYPSDIDVFEIFGKKLGPKETTAAFKDAIQRLVAKLVNRGNYWILEVKCGKDARFDISTDDPNISSILKLYQEYNLFETAEQKIINEGDASMINEMLRNKANIRWSVDEIFSGNKQLAGGVVVSLYDAILTGSQINIECIALIGGKFVDISNFFILMYIDHLGKEHAINLPEMAIINHHNFQVLNLKNAIKKLMYDPAKKDFYKVTKRLWSYGRFTHDRTIIEKLMPFINSIVALVGQKRSEIKTLINLAKHTLLKGIPMDIFVNQVSNIKLPISSAIELGRDRIARLNELLDSVQVDSSYNVIVHSLSLVYTALDAFVQTHSIRFLKESGFYPLPNYLQ